jgi:UDP-3-O-[3-hydroxymyristoyl] N-acetylglucosamine deacetylase
MVEYQHTLAAEVSCSGVGLHTGAPVNLKLLPAHANSGIVFRRADLEGFEIAANGKHVARVSYATSLMRKGVLISTTEHLLSALAGLGVDNVVVELDNLEVPIMDGSALPFARMIQQAGLKQQRSARRRAHIQKPFQIEEGAKRVAVHPASHFRVTYHIDFPHPLIGQQTYEYAGSVADYYEAIAPARTFGFLRELESLRTSGLVRGGSLKNAVVMTDTGVMNPEGLRFADEFCRHKVLDFIGDLAMFVHPLNGHFHVWRGGHALHYSLVSRLQRETSLWTLEQPRSDKADLAQAFPASAAVNF